MKGATYESDPFSRIPSVGRHSPWAGRRLLVIGEVITFPGKWSSYIPHHHPQPECTTYRFNRPEGFDCAFIGDQAYKITDHSLGRSRADGFILRPPPLDTPSIIAG